MTDQTDFERLEELIRQERLGFEMDFELTGRHTRWGEGYVAALERAAEIVREFGEESKEFNSGDLPHKTGG